MNTILAFSDSHGDPLPQSLVSVAAESKYVFFLGDGISELGGLLTLKNLHVVRGNCDRAGFKSEEIVQVDGVKILLTHGHEYNVKRNLLLLACRAKELGCSVVFYGHTHFASIDECEGVTLICPGAMCRSYFSKPSYAYAVVSGGKLTCKIVDII